MKKLFIVLIGASVLFSSCKKHKVKPSSDITTMERFVDDFVGVEIADAIEATITYSNGSQKVVVEANSNVHPYILTKVDGGRLKVCIKKGVSFKKEATIKVHITLPQITVLKASGASNVTLMNQIEANHIDIEASGASRIYGSLSAASSYIKLSGASEVNFQGVSNLTTINLSGASQFDSFNFHINDLNADLSGASNAYVTVNDNLNLVASGASSFHYSGNCVIGELNLSGSSTIHKH